MSNFSSSIAPSEEPPAAITGPKLPFSTRINYAIRLWAFKIFVKLALGLKRRLKPLPPANRPTYTKYYGIRPMVKNRVFIPSSYKDGDRKLPLYINIHGGGFALCDPEIDDEFASYLANKHGICVVSIGYRLAPSYAHPTQVNDCAALARAVLEDGDLPIDSKKVATGGFSAGGNLALAMTQMDGLKGKLGGVMGFYPKLDFTKGIEEMLKYRPVTEKPDMLLRSGKWFNWAYVPEDADKRDPLLSPTFAKKEDLPPKIFLLGCELDILCKEGEDLAESLAKDENGSMEPLHGGGVGWQKGGVRWEKVMGCEHGFDHVQLSGEKEAARRKIVEEVHGRAAQWLWEEVYDNNNN
ncbi:hypothetical protein MMC20_006484 [Loxospora ochrophaea]|nr:hypothetical protein [Loxospora ochrophaea]